ncbi:DUF3048 domain-containing protein [Streptomyces tagetis]|uniref:DUF3048 domain-containing protein n=1 Tax=Streptomyces tagetis TaxID=2820809 RepID=A0A940XCP2_9ACTN|nr:DUF3048 domain-containing protein [Streptomyces sp. RG38]
MRRTTHGRQESTGAGAVRRRGGIGRALPLALAALALAAGCTAGVDDGRPPRPEPPGGSVLAVKIDNAPAARPQTGLDTADVVYAEPVEAGLSRLMALYSTRLPDSVGPVRSARESDLELLRQFDRPTLAFSGAQTRLLPLIDRAPLRAEPPEKATGAYVREKGRPAPHNLYVRPDRLLPKPAGEHALTTGFRYGEAPPGGRPESSRTVRYPSASFTFTWSASRGGWLVDLDGRPASTPGGERLAPPTVVVQHVKVRASGFGDFRGNNSPYVESVGSGRAEVLRDGRVHEAAWKRGAAEDGTSFTAADGTPVNFAEGPVWVVFTGS